MPDEPISPESFQQLVDANNKLLLSNYRLIKANKELGEKTVELLTAVMHHRSQKVSASPNKSPKPQFPGVLSTPDDADNDLWSFLPDGNDPAQTLMLPKVPISAAVPEVNPAVRFVINKLGIWALTQYLEAENDEARRKMENSYIHPEIGIRFKDVRRACHELGMPDPRGMVPSSAEERAEIATKMDEITELGVVDKLP